MNNDLDKITVKLSQTTRPTVAKMENILQLPHKVLDHGFIKLVDYMGDDDAVVQAARVSHGMGTKKHLLGQDRALIRYLMKHDHTSPFEQCEIKFHCKLPIFVARQWIRHRTANVNEISARYSILDREFYVPGQDQLAKQSQLNKQGRGAPYSYDEAAYAIRILQEGADRSFADYATLVQGPDGLSRELARTVLPLSTYTQWYWKTDLHNLFHFLKLRCDSHAQYEIRAYADVILNIVRQWVPICCEAFEDYRLNGVTLSRHEFDIIKWMVHGRTMARTDKMSQREWEEFTDKFGIIPTGD